MHYGALGKIFIEFDINFDFDNTRLYHLGKIPEHDSHILQQILSSEEYKIEEKEPIKQEVTFENIFDWPMLVVNSQTTLNKPVYK